MTERYLIVNADDFGQSPGVNRGIIEAHERGIVTSASLMVRWPAAAAAAAYGRTHPGLGLGLHLDLGEWAYRDGDWIPVYRVTSTDDPAAVAGEVSAQLAAFRHLAGSEPTHIDSHQHVHTVEPVRSIAAEAARRLGVPLRGCTRGIRYCGDFYGQTTEGSPVPEAVGVARLIGLLEGLGPGITELGCHPGDGDDLRTMYRRERRWEVESLCDPRVRAALEAGRLRLCSFREVEVREGPARVRR